MNLNNVIEYETRRWEFTLVESKSTDGSFLLHHYLSEFLKQSALDPAKSTRTILVTLAQTLGHYKGAQSKLGNSTRMNEALASGQFVHVDLMEPLGDSTIDPGLNFAAVFDQAFAQVKSKCDGCARVNVLVDDLSIPGLIGVDDKVTLGFWRKLRLLENLGSMIVYIQLFDKWFVNDLVHAADLVVRCQNLATGYSKEIDGQVFEKKKKNSKNFGV